LVDPKAKKCIEIKRLFDVAKLLARTRFLGFDIAPLADGAPTGKRFAALKRRSLPKSDCLDKPSCQWQNSTAELLAF
jgi:hypothetical protein